MTTFIIYSKVGQVINRTKLEGSIEYYAEIFKKPIVNDTVTVCFDGQKFEYIRAKN